MYKKEGTIMIKIVCVMAAHRREKITTKTIQRLHRQQHKLDDIVLIGDSKIEKNVAKKTGCKYVTYHNTPLSDKWQAGVDYARKLKPDAIMICGSDSWHTNNWTKRCATLISKGFDLVGTTFFYTCKSYPNKELRIVARRYVGKRAVEPVGSGRIISSRILDEFDWQLFPKGLRSGLDKPSYDKILDYGGKVEIIYHDIKVMGIKSNWDTLNPWKDNFRSRLPVRFLNEVENPKIWLKRNFDEAVKDLVDVTPKLIIKK